jgi:predicted NUDIX family NTP pyrophosphohydrolase
MSGSLRSAGLLPFRFRPGLQVLIGHPGGPFFARADGGAWSVIKGLVDRDEPLTTAAAREFEEETGWSAPPEPWIPLGETTLKSRKVVVAYAVEHDFDPAMLDPGTFTLYGRVYPELDRVEWFDPGEARRRLNPAQAIFIDRLEDQLGLNGPDKE